MSRVHKLRIRSTWELIKERISYHLVFCISATVTPPLLFPLFHSCIPFLFLILSFASKERISRVSLHATSTSCASSYAQFVFLSFFPSQKSLGRVGNFLPLVFVFLCYLILFLYHLCLIFLFFFLSTASLSFSLCIASFSFSLCTTSFCFSLCAASLCLSLCTACHCFSLCTASFCFSLSTALLLPLYTFSLLLPLHSFSLLPPLHRSLFSLSSSH